jgi:2-amino-4-hydroxy-6-hydroxymethyldihydropteridine diphosphokinase
VETTSFIIALGSNCRHVHYGAPANVIRAALEAINLDIVARSSIITSVPVGPSLRRYANAVAMIETTMGPPELLLYLKRIEASFGRRQRGQRWGARVLDLDIILWSGGIWSSSGLGIPHATFRARHFVLNPASQIAADWRDPITGLSLRHLKARLDRADMLP